MLFSTTDVFLPKAVPIPNRTTVGHIAVAVLKNLPNKRLPLPHAADTPFPTSSFAAVRPNRKNDTEESPMPANKTSILPPGSSARP